MNPTPTLFRSKALIPLVVSSALLAFDSAQAVNATFIWNGAGVGSNAGSYWDASGSYTGAAGFSSTTDLNLSAINSTGQVTLNSTTNGTVSVGSIYFATAASTATTPTYVTLNGNGSTILNMTGNIYVPSPGGSVIKFDTGLTLDLTNGAHSLSFTKNNSITATPATMPVLIVNSKVTGGGASAIFNTANSQMGSTYATPALVLTNNSNTYDGAWGVAGMFSYTSINNTGAAAGPSSLGTAVLSSGSIAINKAALFSYVGSGNQSTNRTFSFTSVSGAINNYASTPSTLTLNGAFNTTTTAASTVSFGVSSGNNLTVQSAIGNGPSAGILGLTKSSSGGYYDANGILRAADGHGTLVLAGANTYTGTTTVAGGTLQVGTGGASSTGNLINSGGTYSALTFSAAGGTFAVNEASGVSQQMGTLTFGFGDGTVQSINNGGTSNLSFTSLAARTKGATGNFVLTNGDASTNKITLTGQSAGAMGAAYFFGGNSANATYAYVDTTGGTPTVRGISYGTDAGTQNNTTGAQFTAGSNVKVSTANVTGLTTQTIKTLEIGDTSTVALANNNTLTTEGILKTGGNTSAITGGTIALANGNDLVVRVDQASDFLTIGSKISVTQGLTKSGAGTLRLTASGNVFGTNTYLNGGNLQVAAGSLPNGFGVYFNGGNLEFLGAAGTSAMVNPALTFNDSGTIKVDVGTTYLTGGVNLAGSGANTVTFTGDGGVLETGVISGAGAVTKTGKGTVALAGVNTYGGATTVKEGTLRVDFTATSTSQTNTASNYVSASSSLVLDGGTLEVAGRANGGNVAGGAAWTGQANRATLTFAGGVPSGLVVGQGVSGTNIQPGAYIISIVGNVVTLSSTVTGITGNDLSASATSVTTSQTFGNTTVAAGASTVSVNNNNSAGSVLNLNTISRNVGSTVNLTLPSGTQSASNGITTITANGSNGILGGYATVGGSDWAVSGGNGATAGNITALSSYGTDYSTADATTNFDATASGAFSGQAVNSLRFNTAAPVTVALNGATTVSSGGILVTSAVGSNAASISGGTSLTSGNGTDLIVQQNNTASAFTVATKITGAIGLTKSGAGDLVLSGANDYTGGTYINAGKVVVSGGIHGSLVDMASGSTLDIIGTLAAGNSGSLTPVTFTLEGTASIVFEAGSKLALNVGADSAASTVAFSTLGEWLSGSNNATLELVGNIDYSSNYKVFSNVDTLFGFANIMNYDTSHYLAQVSMVGNDEVLSFTAVPEPSTWAMIVGGVGMLVAGQKIRRRSIEIL